MKKTFTNKIISVMMAAMMVVSLAPSASFAVGSEAEAPQSDEQIVQDVEKTDQAASENSDASNQAAFEQSEAVDDVIITVSAEEGVFPADAVLSVEKLDQSWQKKADEAVDAIRPDGTNPALSYTYDIKVIDADGSELQPADGKRAEVSFAMAPAADKNLVPAVYHITEVTEGEEAGEMTAETLEASVNEEDETVTVEAGGFSLYTVEFTYEDKQYVLKGDESVPLTEIMEEAGLTGQVESAEVSNEELFSVSEDEGVWTLTSHQAFYTQEWLKVTIGGAEYVIIVTDAPTDDADDSIQVSTWDELYNACKNAPDNKSTAIRLSGDIKRPDSSNNKRIEINKNKKIVIDLNGKTINAARDDDGWDTGKYNHVLDVHKGGDLTVKDSSGNDSGTIKKGAAYNGGGIYISEGGVCRIEGGTILNNYASEKGAAIYTEGTLIMTGGVFNFNTCEERGGAIYCAKSGSIQLEDVKFLDNDSGEEGGPAIYIVLGNDNSYIKKCEVKDSGSYLNYSTGNIYVDADNKDRVLNISKTNIIDGCIYGYGGGIYLKKGTVQMTGGRIANNNCLKYTVAGGGVYVDTDQATFNADSVLIENCDNGKSTDGKGGGIYINKGSATLKNCTVKNNSVGGNGGGIYVTKNSGGLRLINTKVTGNTAAVGGGVYFEDKGYAEAMSVGGNTVIAENAGSDVYLPGSMVLFINQDHPLESGANIGLTRTKGPGKFTILFELSMGASATPDTYFFSNEGYMVTKQGTEGYLAVDLDEDSKFLKRSERIITNVGRLGPAYWMAGVSGERYLNEINIPGTHDTSMNNVSHKGCLSGKFGAAQAKTQREYLEEQLNHGARFFDIRMKTYYCKGEKKIWPLTLGATVIACCIPVVGPVAGPLVATATGIIGYNDSTIPVYKDDGVNLWACHGRSAAGTFYALNEEDEMLSVAEELECMKEFLRNHPTETIIIDARAETDAKDGESFYGPLKRFSGIMEELSAEINPSTGESYVYWEDGKVGETFTRWPKLKDCRGKIVIFPSKGDNAANTIGGLKKDTDGITVETGPGNYKDNTARAENLRTFIQSMKTEIPRNAMGGQMKEFNWIQTNTTDTSFMKTPVGLAENYVLPVVFGSNGLVNESKKGTYFGWFSIDAARMNHLRDVWITNFPDDLDYCTITVRCGDFSGSDLPVDQVYKVLRGSTITIPGCIYSGAQADKFEGWLAQVDNTTGDGTNLDGAVVDGKTYTMNNTCKIDKDVTFVAQWSDQTQTPVTVVWKDADDLDNIKPDELTITYDNGVRKTDKTIEAPDWTIMLSGELKGKPSVKEENIPDGYTVEDVAGSKGKEGYTITMTHTPDVKVNASGTVTWNDENNKDSIRPESVTLRLYANGEEVESGTVTENESGKWSFDLGTWPRYDENADLIAYKLVEDEISFDEKVYSSGYTSGVEAISGEKNAITGFNVTNTHEVETAVVYARIEWDDDNNAKGERPESVTVQWKKNGEPYGDPIIVQPEEEAEGEWIVGLELTYAEMKAIGEQQDEIAESYKEGELTEEEFIETLKNTMTYTIEQEGINHYTTTVTWKEGEGEGDDQTAPYFRILNTYAENEQ
ncbi:MAG: Cna B-type domain-containing protein, partial [Lachnospiraceae bacterium]|nr:Cna B-type domain-containing protein [Lachnospiraceae bacterium]